MEPETRLRDLVERYARETRDRGADVNPPLSSFPGKPGPAHSPGLLARAKAWATRPKVVTWRHAAGLVFVALLMVATMILDYREQQIAEAIYRYQSIRIQQLKQRLRAYETAAPIRELPPPYTEVRSGFPDWHICTTDDCGTPRNEPF